ncbi:DUF4408 domain-containing protein [Citrus sinensis]|uniref:DUF4408 domain-containing protein n=2 Tax=Citrus TaxID=2706 RepID=A0ACB8NP86_CITSI|nr:adenylate cyclase, terminal-differentiation specific [Citrus x clementina]XP_024953497.1 pathogen-associated molecular patterns-induced protein A70 isoform X2 [Citrus sinensis]ESR64087.1 hypothetical protein CICLE_v10008860mg [Citrus x clementina]KAH9761633.1 DUF4408 domain-containing protein [Citrus sinensis]KAH9800027.1 DUF4408 domain-containing protein [Citrus sinensis]
MFEESVSFIPSIWASMNSWFTPTVLFVFLNIMIGTIAITSSLATQKGNDQQQQQQHQEPYRHPQLVRTPSVLQRLKSINFYNYRSPEPNTNFAQNTHFTSHHFNQEQEQEQQQEEPQYQHQPPLWGRSPSMLQKFKSINLYNYFSQESTTLDKSQEAAHTHYPPNQARQQEQDQGHNHLEPEQEYEEEGPKGGGEEEEEEEEGGPKGEEEDHFQDQEQTFDEIYSQLKGSNSVARTKSDTKPASGEILKKLPKKMKKSASSKSAFNHFREEDIVEVEARRPATVKEFGNAKVAQVDDEGVDAKADDFIHKFKQQLKLQRMDSIIRYNEMVNRGSGR